MLSADTAIGSSFGPYFTPYCSHSVQSRVLERSVTNACYLRLSLDGPFSTVKQKLRTGWPCEKPHLREEWAE